MYMHTLMLYFFMEAMVSAALSVMEKHKPRPATVLPVIDENKIPMGIINLTNLLCQGVV